IPEETIEHEREIARAQLEKSGKPQNIWDKIVEGKVNAFYDQVCLLKQKYIRDEGVTIAQYLAKNGKDLKVTGMLRWTVGEG
ncbi:MAG: elongation factor Ts, partial [Chlamydiia bacterium]|nr:elongation factor Ts [Chlamydiia bacterium]